MRAHYPLASSYNNKSTHHILQDIKNTHIMVTKMAHTCLLLLLLPAFLTFTSSNQLTGELPESLQSSAYEDSFLGNCGLCAAANLTVSIPACRYSSHNQMLAGLIILLASVLAGAILIGAVGCFIVRRKKQQDRDVASWKMMPFRKLDFSECDVLTNLREEDVIGSGGSGKVYRVHLPGRGHGRGCGGTVVAVKKLWSRGKAEEKLDREFDTEVKMLGDIRHNNIVSLLCYISSEDTKLLVYEYMENGSLDRWLHPKDNAATAVLDWPTRLGIAIDAARGLSYMHDECAQPIMHRDIKSSNILLDPGLHAKIADFGLARILLKSESVSGVGSMAAPEEFFGEEANQKADVYRFGMVLLELATGRAENDLVELAWPWRHHKPGGPLHDVVDKRIHDRALYLEDAVAVFQLGVMCTGDDPQSRPSMGHVLQQLITISGTGTTTCHQAAA